MLGCTANGLKFSPYVIFKGKNTPNGRISRRLHQVDFHRSMGIDNFFGFETSNFYAVQDKAWMESSLVVDWLKQVYQPWAEEQTGPTILILDEFAGHMTSEVRDCVSSIGAHLIFIPGGYTWKLQPMDIGLNKPFKDKVRDLYDDWAYENNHDAKPTREAVSSWNKRGWEQGVKYSTIIKTWEKIGVLQDEPEEFEYDPDEDVFEDGEGIDFLDLDENVQITEKTDEEAEADRLYNDYDENEIEEY
jgi:hypothetical protein